MSRAQIELDRLLARAVHPASAASAAAFRMAFGLLGLVAVVRTWVLGWIDELYVVPTHHFSYLGFGWVQPWPAWGMYAHFALLGLASLAIALGYRYRLATAAFFVLFTYVELIDKTTYLNHYYWMSLTSLLMVVLPLHRTASLDARRNPERPPPTVAAWVIWALRAQVGVVYVFAGLAKLNPDWLLYAQPLRIWLYNSGDVALIGPLLRQSWVAYLASWAGAAYDLTVVGWLLWPRSRPLAYAAVVVFHVATWVLFPIGLFPWVMIAATLIFFPPDWPRRLWAWIGRSPPPGDLAASSSPAVHRVSRVAVLALALVALAQIIIPLRHWAYPGNVRWNEEGYRFAWRVMLTEKTGEAQFHVSDPATGERWVVNPDQYLTPLQVERMAYQPDMILETAHLIARYYARQGRDVEVRAEVFVAFNGRRAARLIDPNVNLARAEHGLAPKTWILPAPKASPA